MSHIHLPDGVLPLWLWLGGYVLAALLVAVLWRGGQATAGPRQFALLGVLAALMILVMSVEIPPFAFHINLAVVTGILLGPRLAVLAALLVNVILALVGHGGITVVGLNTLVLSTEMVAGYAFFHALKRARVRVTRAGFAATLLGLAAGAVISFAIVAIGSPWIDRMLQSARVLPGSEAELGVVGAHLDLRRLAVLLFGLGSIGWLLEGLLSGAVLGYLSRVYPEVLDSEG